MFFRALSSFDEEDYQSSTEYLEFVPGFSDVKSVIQGSGVWSANGKLDFMNKKLIQMASLFLNSKKASQR